MPNKREVKEEGELLTRKEDKVKKPRRYWAILHNDDYTTQEFVVHILESIFHKNKEQAEQLMMDVHLKGQASVGLYSKDVAETKADHAMLQARENGMPLKVSTKPE